MWYDKPRHRTTNLDDDHNLDLTSRRNRQLIFDKSGGFCWYCGKQMQPLAEFTIDHQVPPSAGGRNNYANLVPCCDTCNSRKSAKSLEEFRAAMTCPNFSRVQREFLEAAGFDFGSLPTYRFWFERRGGNQ